MPCAMSLSVLVVGGENLCRSPLGAVLLAEAASAAGVPASVRSAGFRVRTGYPVDTFTDLVAREHGVDLSSHRARQITGAGLREADLVLVMDHGLRREVQDFAPNLSHRVRLFDHWLGGRGIADPRHRSREFYQAVHRLIAEAAGAGAEHLTEKLFLPT